ncbi:hypothetical protein BKA61DRAFT_617070 [Leptodontidium sp. MPI-SDFR-AT-0119]|nr:hypothetical protein BKA61DRAFT_617070 [Leptodontidium sp. MPI-SDFR-AT-0119]
MSYRVETALSKRAGCQATECKANGVKIDKDDLRLGIWVDYGERAGWVWRHWGCVTGKVLQGLRNLVTDPDTPGSYRWDMLDGFESGDKNSLDKNPALQEKVRRCITQGFIDPEDFNGDPEMNVLGAVGLHTKETKKKMRDEKKESARNEEIDDLKTQIAALTAEKAAGGNSNDLDARIAYAQAALDKRLSAGTPATKKRVKDEADAEEGTPAKKKRTTKKKAEDDEDEDVKPAKPAPKSRAKKVKKEEDDNADNDEDIKPTPAKRSRAKKAVKKEEEDDDEDVQESKPARAKKARAKKGIKKEEEDDDEAVQESKPAKKPRAKKTIKKEEDTEMSGTVDDHIAVKDEDVESAPKPAPKKRAPSKKKAVKAEVGEDESVVKNEEDEDLVKPAPKKRAPRGKKAVKVEAAEDGSGIDDAESKPKPAAKKGRKKAVKDENVEEEGIKDEPATESSNPGITEGSSVLSDLPDLPEGMKDPVDAVAMDESNDLVVPAKNRRTRSRTVSNKV